MDLSPFEMLEPAEEGGSWSLYLSSMDASDSRSVFEKANRHAGGYGWEGVALYLLEQVLGDEVADQIRLDCENDTFVARSADATALRKLGSLMAPLARDRRALAKVLRRAPVDSWSEQFLR